MATPAVTYTFAANTLIKASEANTNFQDIIDFLTTHAIQKDASLAFTATPSGPGADPTTDNQFARKAYVDARDSAVLGGKKFGAGVSTVTTGSGGLSSGYATVTHGLGWEPTGVVVTGRSPIGGGNILASIVADTMSSTTFRVRCINQSGAGIEGESVTFQWIAFAAQ